MKRNFFKYIFVSFVCMFCLNLKTKALECYYDVGYIDPSDTHYDSVKKEYDNHLVVVKYEKNKYSLGVYDKTTKKTTYTEGQTKIFTTDYLTYYLYNDSETESDLKDTEIKNGKCPTVLYYVLDDGSSNNYYIKYSFSENIVNEFKKKYKYDSLEPIQQKNLRSQFGNVNSISIKKQNDASQNLNNNCFSCEYADAASFIISKTSLFKLNICNSSIGIENNDSSKYYFNFDRKEIGNSCPQQLYIASRSSDYTVNIGMSKSDFPDQIPTKVLLVGKLTITEETTSDSMGCDSFPKTKKIISSIYNLIRFVVPTIIIVLSVLDFVGVVFSGEQEKMGKAKKRFAMRIIAGLLFLFVPSILELLFRIAGILGSEENLVDITCSFFDM